MFVHLVKDFLKKIEEVEKRLGVSADRDEVQTLGLKLRFFHSEIKHYQKMLSDVRDRIGAVQEKYGFQPEEDDEAPAQAKSVADNTQPDKKPAGDEDVVSLVSTWINRLEQEGIDPREVLRSAGGESRPSAPAVELHGDREATDKVIAAAAARSVTDIYKRSTAKKDDDDGGIAHRPMTEYIAKPEEAEFDGSADEDINVYAPREHGGYDEVADDEAREEAVETAEDDAGYGELSAGDILAEYEDDNEDASAALEEMDEPAPAAGADAPPEAVEAAGPDVREMILGWAAKISESASSQIEALEEMDSLCSNKREAAEGWLGEAAASGASDLFGCGQNGAIEFCAGYLASALGRPGTAINWLEASLDKGLLIGNSLVLLAELHFEKKIYKRALGYFRQAEDVAGVGSRTSIGIVRCLNELGMFEELSGELDKRDFNGGEEEYETNRLRAHALAKLGRYDSAVKLLQNLLESDCPDVWKGRYALQLGGVKEKAGDVMMAVESYEKSLEYDNSNPETLFSIGRIYLEHNAIPLAKSHLLTLARRFPESLWSDRARDILYREGLM